MEDVLFCAPGVLACRQAGFAVDFFEVIEIDAK